MLNLPYPTDALRHMTKHKRHVSVTSTISLSSPQVNSAAMLSTSRAPSQDKDPAQEAFEQNLSRHLRAQRRGRADVPGAARVRAGLPLSALDDIQRTVGLSSDQLESLLGTSTRTLQRRRQRSEDLTPAESDRLWRLLYVWHLAVDAFGSDEAAHAWLTEPHGLLRSEGRPEGCPESPLGRLDTEPGLREVEDMLTVIDETAAA